MRTLFILSTLLLSACGQQLQSADPRTVVGVDEEFIHYVDYYKSLKPSGKLDYDIPIAFVKLEGNVVGLCTRWSNGYRQIQIDPDYWAIAPERFKVSLIFHELGHCDLNRDHSPYISSIMYFENRGSNDFDELFGIPDYTQQLKLAHNHDNCVHDIEVE